MQLYKNLQNFVGSLNVKNITDERRQILQALVDYVQSKVKADKPVRLNFVCTHNSRRSHLSQIWAQTMAYYFGIKNVCCYSAGTKATALHSMVVETLHNTGFQIQKLSASDNPVYSIKYAENEFPIIGFSKNLDAAFNPKSEFCAIMTCSQADASCPLIVGAEKRMPITFADPKIFDDTPQQAKKYSEASMHIATQMFFVFSKVRP